MRTSAVCLSLLLAGPALAAPEPDRPKVGVLRFEEVAVTPEFAGSVAAVVANELDRSGAFKLTTADAIKELLALERQRVLLGCGADTSCMTEIVDALGLDYLVTGKVQKAGTGPQVQWTVTLTLLNVGKSKREGSEIVTAASEPELLSEARRATRTLVSGLLRARSGTLAISVSEPGATVKLNDIAVGVSPLTAAISVPGGAHRLAVEKKGFVISEQEVQIAAGQETKAEVKLLPSADYARDYQAHHQRMRLGAWITTGVAGAGLLAGGLFQLRAQSLYGESGTDGTFLYYRQRLSEGVETDGTTDFRQEATRLGAEIESSEFLSRVSLIAAGVGAAGAAFFWIAGEDPDRYSRASRPAVAVVPTTGGFAGAVTWTFD